MPREGIVAPFSGEAKSALGTSFIFLSRTSELAEAPEEQEAELKSSIAELRLLPKKLLELCPWTVFHHTGTGAPCPGPSVSLLVPPFHGSGWYSSNPIYIFSRNLS